MKRAKICTVCGMEKESCLAEHGGNLGSRWQPDARSYSSPDGIAQLSTVTLQGMARGNAGEGESVVKLASAELRRRADLEKIGQDETILSRHEQQIYRAKGIPIERRRDGFVRPVALNAQPHQMSREQRRKLFLQSKSQNKVERTAAMHALSPPKS